MIPDLPTDPRQALETSLTALLLGELPSEQAEFLQRTIDQDPALARQYERLKQTIQLVHETGLKPHKEPAPDPEPLKLSHGRREELLQRFKTVTPKQFVGSSCRPEVSWVLAVAAAFVIVGLLSTVLLSTLSKGKSRSSTFSLASNKRLSERQLNLDDRDQLSKLGKGSKSRESLSHPANLPILETAKSESPKPARTSIVLPTESAPSPTPKETSQAIAGREWSFSASARGQYDELTRQLPTAGPSSGMQAGGVTLSGGGGLGGGGGLTPSVLQRPPGSQGTASEQIDRGRLQEALRNSGAPANPVIAQSSIPSVSADAPLTRRYGLILHPSAGETPTENSFREQEFNKKVNQSSVVDPNTGLPIAQAAPTEIVDPALGLPVSKTGAAQEPAATSPNAISLSLGVEDKLSEGDQKKTSVLADEPAIGQLFAGSKDLKGVVAIDAEKLKRDLARADQLNLQKGKSGALDFYSGGAFGGYSTIKPVEGLSASDGTRGASLPVSGQVPLSMFGETWADGTQSANEPAQNQADSSKLVKDGRLLYENGKLDEAEAKLKQAIEENPKNQEAYYYLNLADEARVKESLLKGELESNQGVRQFRNPQSLPPTTVAGVVIGGKALIPEHAQATVLAQSETQTQLASGQRSKQLEDELVRKPSTPALIPQPEVQTAENSFSTFSLNVSDVSFKLAAASLEKGILPEAGSLRTEEFINAFDYRDPEAAAGLPIAFSWERAQYPFAHNRDLLRFSLKTATRGREEGRPLNVVLLLDNSGSMERADRVSIIHEALRVLATQFQAQDTVSVVTFARTARLWVDGVPGTQAARVADQLSSLTPEGGTNLEEAMNLAYQTALRHYLPNGINRVVLLTDGAANLGQVEPEPLKSKVESYRKQGIALDCFGIGWEGYNDDLLQTLARSSNGRYGFINTPEEAATQFASQLAGALQVAASDVKVQVEFNPTRVTTFRQLGYAKHQLTKEQFRDNTVDAAELGAAESGNALYVIETNAKGEGPLAIVRVRYKIPGTTDYREHEWTVPYTGSAVPLGQSSPAMRLAGSAASFAEWLASSPYATEITTDALLRYLTGVPEIYGADLRPKKLEWMLRQAKSLSGK